MKKNESRSKSILMIHGTSDLYGGSKILLITAELLARNGYKVHVVLDREGPLFTKLKEFEIPVSICELGILRRKYMTPWGILNRVKALYIANKNLKQLCKKIKADLIYSNTTGVLIGAYLANNTGLKHIWHVHEIIENPAYFTKIISWHLNKFADQVVVVSNEVRKHWIKFVNKEKIKVVYNGLKHPELSFTGYDLKKELKLNEGVILVGMIGRVNLWKGQKYFLNMAKLITEKNKDVRFVMVGDAYEGYEYLYQEIENHIKSLNLQNHVYNLGYRTDIQQILEGFDLFILPSIEPDPLPTVVLEAMGAGKAVVATAHGGALEMVEEGETGILIPWDNPKNAVDSFSHLLDNKKLRELMGNQGRQRALNFFSIDRYQKDIIEIIENI